LFYNSNLDKYFEATIATDGSIGQYIRLAISNHSSRFKDRINATHSHAFEHHRDIYQFGSCSLVDINGGYRSLKDIRVSHPQILDMDGR
jgi:hypothetical protein